MLVRAAAYNSLINLFFYLFLFSFLFLFHFLQVLNFAAIR